MNGGNEPRCEREARRGDQAGCAAGGTPQRRGGPGEQRRRLAVGVLASGRGTNLQALLDASADPAFPARVVLVISDRPGAEALARAQRAGVTALALEPRAYPGREAFDAALAERLAAAGVELVCLAGYLRILSQPFVRRWAGRILNIHPSLLPAFPGLRAQEQAWRYGVRYSGCTVHFVDEGVDTGPIILQAVVPVLPGDDADALAARILAEEHRIYPEAVRLFAEGRLSLEGRRVTILGQAGADRLQGG